MSHATFGPTGHGTFGPTGHGTFGPTGQARCQIHGLIRGVHAPLSRCIAVPGFRGPVISRELPHAPPLGRLPSHCGVGFPEGEHPASWAASGRQPLMAGSGRNGL